jgi:hypothetical protein
MALIVQMLLAVVQMLFGADLNEGSRLKKAHAAFLFFIKADAAAHVAHVLALHERL